MGKPFVSQAAISNHTCPRLRGQTPVGTSDSYRLVSSAVFAFTYLWRWVALDVQPAPAGHSATRESRDGETPRRHAWASTATNGAVPRPFRRHELMSHGSDDGGAQGRRQAAGLPLPPPGDGEAYDDAVFGKILQVL